MTLAVYMFVLCLLILTLGLLAGLRLSVVLREQREQRRGGYLDLRGIDL